MVALPCVACSGDAPGRAEDYTAPFLQPIYPVQPILDLDVLLSGGEAPSSGLPVPFFLTAHSSSPRSGRTGFLQRPLDTSPASLGLPADCRQPRVFAMMGDGRRVGRCWSAVCLRSGLASLRHRDPELRANLRRELEILG